MNTPSGRGRMGKNKMILVGGGKKLMSIMLSRRTRSQGVDTFQGTLEKRKKLVAQGDSMNEIRVRSGGSCMILQ